MASSKKKKDIWKLDGVQKAADEHIEAGILLKKDGLQKLCDRLNKAFEDDLGRKKFHAKDVEEHIVWSKPADSLVKHYVSRDLKLEPLYERFKDTRPQDMVDRRARKHRGHRFDRKQAETSPAGAGRVLIESEILTDKQAQRILPEITRARPYKIKVRDPDSFSVLNISGPSIGLLYSKVLDDNPLRCALREAHIHGDDVIHITGGLMFLDVKYAQGHLKIHRAMLSGMNYDPEVMDPDYRPMADKVHDAQPPDEIVYETLREQVLNLMHGFKRNATDENGNALCDAPVLIEFSVAEEELSEAIAQAEVRYITYKHRDELQGQIDGQKAMLRYELKMSDGLETAETRAIKVEIRRLRKIYTRFIMRNASHPDSKRRAISARAWLIKQFEENIPNSKVIAQGTTHVQIGGQVITIRQHRGINATEMALDKYLKEKAGLESLRGTLPNVVLLSSPFMVNFRWAAREHGSQNDRKTTWVYQLPVAMDKGFLEDETTDMIRKVAQPERVLRHPRFEPGVVRLRFTHGMWQHQRLSMSHLKHAFEVKRTAKAPKKPEEYMYAVVHTDDHTGDPWREEYYDSRSGLWLGHMPAFMTIMKRAYHEARHKLVPFHFYWMLDDETQGHHFPTQSQPHQQVEPFEVLQSRFKATVDRAKATNTPAGAIKELERLQTYSLEQIRYRGSHWPQMQVEEFLDRIVVAQSDFYEQLIARSKAGNVRILGRSELDGTLYDSRDAALVTFGSGNHFDNTVNRELSEGMFYRRELINLLRGKKSMRGVDLKRVIRNPLYGNTAIGWGRIVGGSDGYEWGLSLRSSPSRKSGANGDPLDQAAKNAMERGDFARIFGNGNVVIHLSGDIHRFAQVSLSDAELINGAPCKDTDPYGERGFSPNNVGNLVVGFPRKGPEYGPIRVIPINHDFVRRYMLKPWQVDWETIFSNPV